MKKLNLGCATDYLEGFVNIDMNKNIKADVYCNFEESLPFEDNTFDYVYASHILEHISYNNFFKFIEEIWRVCKNGAKIDILCPHSTSIMADAPYHYQRFNSITFDTFTLDGNYHGERYSSARFKINKIELHFVLKYANYRNFNWIKIFGFLNILFNLSKFWQKFMERCWIFGFDEVEYKLEVVKN